MHVAFLERLSAQGCFGVFVDKPAHSPPLVGHNHQVYNKKRNFHPPHVIGII